MKILLFLNGPEGWQTGIEDGFTYLLSTNVIKELEWFYLEDFSNNSGVTASISRAVNIATKFQPDMIVIFHIGKFPITSEFLLKIKNLASKPILAYDEGDMYGSYAKPILKPLKIVLKHVDVVSIRGLGEFYKQVSALNNHVIYTPHHADIARFDKQPFLLPKRKNKLVLIGNRNKSRFLGAVRRLPGAKEREEFVKAMGEAYPNEFMLYGNGWNDFVGNQGAVDFQKQLDVYRDSWITVAYEHYPEIPYYFSNRLPLALLAGSLYVCHYHKGYENIFKNCDFIFFFNTNSEALDLIRYIHSLSNDEKLARSSRARAFALKHYHPNVTWTNFFHNVMEEVVYVNK